MDRRGYVYRKGRRLYLAWYDVEGRRRLTATGLVVGQEAEAERRLHAIRAEVDALRRAGASSGRLTVQQWAEQWVERRARRGIAMVRDERQRLRTHIGPALGHIPLDELTRAQVVAWIDQLRERLAPRSVLHVYGTLRQIMRAAVREGLIEVSPCDLAGDELPRLEDRDPEWRAQAYLSRDELELLLSHPDIPENRRLAYAIMGLGGLRWGEVAALRWRAYDRTLQPLGQLVVAAALSERRRGIAGTKTGSIRRVPVHPVLARMLAEWRLRCGDVSPDDLILPGPEGQPWQRARAYRAWRRDLDRLGLRPRRLHDLRRTMISLARADGADPSIVRWITHTPARGDMVEAYSSLPWETLCSAVARIRLELREGQVIPLRQAVGACPSATALLPPESEKAKAPESVKFSGASMVGDAGFESATKPDLGVRRVAEKPVRSGVCAHSPGPNTGPGRGRSGVSGSNAATAPEAAVRAAIDGMEPRDARALLLRILAELA